MAKHPIFIFTTSLSLSSLSLLLLVVVFLDISFASAVGDSCQKDDHMGCKYYKPYKSWYCTTSDWIQTNCAKMCGFCDPVNGNWGAFGAYGACSRPCGGGSKARSRSCNNPAPSNGGAPCAGNNEEQVPCNPAACPVCQKDDHKCHHFEPFKSTFCPNNVWVKTNCADMCGLCTTKTMSPVHGNWGKWGDWSNCSKTCGNGQKNRSRECNIPAPMHGERSCDGNATEIDVCKDRECPVDGSWGSWGNYTSCSRTCGGGIQTWKRVCDNPPPSNGGRSCEGYGTQCRQCNTQMCQGDVCGKQYKPAETCAIGIYIFNGENAEEGEWPWQVAIRKNRNAVHPYCGGTLITDNIVLTAAHCFKAELSRKKPKAFRYWVRVGDHDVTRKDPQEEDIRAKKIIIHEQYNYPKDNDIALIVLSKKVTLKGRVQVACLPMTNNPPVPQTNDNDRKMAECYITGWGAMYQNKTQPDILQKLKVPLCNQQDCSDKYGIEHPDVPDIVRDYHICAGGENDKDACQGDSGGPLVCRKSQDQFVVRGVTSFGTRVCAKGLPTVYTNVFHYMDWINKNINAN